ncbi:MAG: FG-GAP-like repeat-containing protein [Desulforhopalus sp.]|nr:FG-GAP-like repeat-containing protein [Desulforhopalus sp.]
MCKSGIVLVFLCFFVLGSTAVFGNESNEKYRVIFTTFDASSAGSYAYLRDGIQSMLVSRLATRDKVVILDRNLSEKELLSLKNKKSVPSGGTEAALAEYLVSGSLYALKGGLNIQVALYPFSADKETLRFEVVAKNPENLISDIDKLVEEIAQSAFGYKNIGSGGATTSKGQEGSSGFVTVHPEMAYKKSVHVGTVAGTPGGSIKVSAKEGKKSLTIPREIRLFAVGDMDGDSADEIVVLMGRSLELYKVEGNKINKISTTNLPPTVDCHAINVADLDNNGRMELYISATHGLDVSSLIVDWDKGKGFRIVSDNIPWYIRPISIPKKGWQLAGQKRGNDRISLVKPGVYVLALDGNGMPKESGRLPLPDDVNLFDFVYADLDGDSTQEIVAIDKKEKMKVFNQANELLWVSKKTFGGSQIYIGPSRGEAVNNKDRKNFTVEEDAFREMNFVPGRLIVADVDTDGRQEIIINENTLSSLSIFEKIRIYNDGVIVGLSWDGTALNESWRTGTFRGYIAGFGFSILAQNDNSGQTIKGGEKKRSAGLYVGHLPKSGTLAGLLPGVGETQLTVYDLEFSSGNTR